MKNSIYKEKFKKTNFVKPLYRVQFAKVTPKLFSDIDSTNLVGDAINVNDITNVTLKETQRYHVLPGGCEEIYKCYDLKCDRRDIMEQQNDGVLSEALRAASSKKLGSKSEEKPISFRDPSDLILGDNNDYKESWLRVHPAPILGDESLGSIVLRFLACQLGITCFIIIWTAIWVAVIHSYEAPHENLVNKQYESQQNQLVIDLATELRMVTPISPKWQQLILTRIKEARKQTLIAAGRGAKMEPGRYWNLAGTFLFTVFVMTALGFGAPVPQTAEGRCFALLYAVFAVPFHVYLMMQASTCAVAHVNYYLAQCHKIIQGNSELKLRGRSNKEDSGNIDLKAYRRRKKLSRLLAMLTVGHCVPIASLLYYAIGVVIFGLGRYQKTDLVDVFMFPLQFTTNGGLATIECHYRVLYGLYVEGAMALLTCSLAALRRYSSSSASHMAEKYRLFTKR